MSGRYQSERHRRKVMREMRLAGYELPETPTRRVNRSYRRPKHNSKVKTSKKVVTGAKRSYMMGPGLHGPIPGPTIHSPPPMSIDDFKRLSGQQFMLTKRATEDKKVYGGFFIYKDGEYQMGPVIEGNSEKDFYKHLNSFRKSHKDLHISGTFRTETKENNVDYMTASPEEKKEWKAMEKRYGPTPGAWPYIPSVSQKKPLKPVDLVSLKDAHITPSSPPIIIENNIQIQEPKATTHASTSSKPPVKKRHRYTAPRRYVEPEITEVRRKKPRKRSSDDGWGDLIESKPRKKRRTAPKKKGPIDSFFDTAEKGWKKVQERRAKRKAYKETEEYKEKLKVRQERWNEGKKEFKARSEKAYADVRKEAGEVKEKFTAPAYNKKGQEMKTKPKSAWDPAYAKPAPKEEE